MIPYSFIEEMKKMKNFHQAEDERTQLASTRVVGFAATKK